MPVDLDWRIGPAGEPVPEPTEHPRDRRRSGSSRRLGLQLLLLAGYLVALAASGWVGFAIGRWRDGRSSYRQEIENQLEVEHLAWREADLDLFTSTLDPEADPAWRHDLISQFVAAAPMPFAARPIRFELAPPDGVLVEVEIETRDGPRTEERAYRLGQATWYRTGN